MKKAKTYKFMGNRALKELVAYLFKLHESIVSFHWDDDFAARKGERKM